MDSGEYSEEVKKQRTARLWFIGGKSIAEAAFKLKVVSVALLITLIVRQVGLIRVGQSEGNNEDERSMFRRIS